ncbi:adenylate/guanylate cyclase domain-containing protein [Coleofasciculus sp. FACHB-SPT9]|uniref:adenylate/guanylate cyclase domain-containing protein n=1 Tax=Cyanophyceae TaxID=3028117 RepID=UPI001686768F|nr:adenylate/guanylate cyclase domain-containing protein [Coleofasciculus sp. FACHB-SPT9]MBD1888933.1 adenylate/guanylate cyclase domain-containing protein [Coleofasciculus sp. FACHB-SPT9]
MLDLPSPILNYIHTLAVENRSPAYLLVEKDGRLSDWGGKLEAYGVNDLQKGEYIGKQVFFLEGLFPLNGSPICIPCMKTEYGLSADVHLVPGEERDWVLLLDATLEESQHRLMQQQGNELNLLREEHWKILNQYFGKDITQLPQAVLTLQDRGERRDVTILSIHICGLTSYSENNPPEVVFKTLNLCIPIMIQILIDEAGIVNKITGDVITAFFGVIASTGCPKNQAIKAARGIIEAIAEIGEARKGELGLTLEIAIGIASGPVTLGILGSKGSRMFTAIGYYVNLAACLESQARPSEILIDENTFQELDEIKKDFLENILLLKGIVEPIRTYSCLVK